MYNVKVLRPQPAWLGHCYLRKVAMVVKSYFLPPVFLALTLGYARGNNIGYKYASETLQSDFIIVLNNDLFLRQKDFSSRVLTEYGRMPYAVMGPDILSLRTAAHQNPAHGAPPTEKEIRKRISEYEYLYAHGLRSRTLKERLPVTGSGKGISRTPSLNVSPE